MRKRECFFAVIMMFVLLALTIIVIAAKSYSDGWNAGFAEAEQQTTEHFKRMMAIQETMQVEEPETEPVIVPIRVDKLPETEQPEPEQPEPEGRTEFGEWWSEDDVFCLAAAIYQEAGGDACTDETRRMVADVVLNRVFDDRFPNTIREVLEDAPGGALQYGRFALTGVCFPAAAENECEKHAVERAYRIANEVLSGEHSALFSEGYIWQAEFAQGSGCVWQDGICFGKG